MSSTQNSMSLNHTSREEISPFSNRNARSSPYTLTYPQGASSYAQPLMSGNGSILPYDSFSSAEGRYLSAYDSTQSIRSSGALFPPLPSVDSRPSSVSAYVSSNQSQLGSLLPPSNLYSSQLGIQYNYPNVLPYQSYSYAQQSPGAYNYSRPLSMPSQTHLLGLHNVLPTNPGAPIQTTKDIQGPEGCNLFVFHIPNDMTNTDLYALFSEFGIVISARIMVDKVSGRSRGFGFVSFEKRENAEDAIAGMNGYQIGHKRLKVQHKKEKERIDYSLPYGLSNKPPTSLTKPTSTTYYHNAYLNNDSTITGSSALDVDGDLSEHFKSSLRIDGSRGLPGDYDRGLDYRDGVNGSPLNNSVGVDYLSPKNPHLLKAGSTDNGRAPIAWVGGSNPAQTSPRNLCNYDLTSSSPDFLGIQNLHN